MQRQTLIRTAQRLGQTSQSSLLRQTMQRRFAHEEIKLPKLEGPMDNAFNRERQAVKAHAAASTDLWRRLCIYIALPALVVASINAKILYDEHWDHFEHGPPISERVQYPYMNIRTKAYPWGDGTKTLFWNDKVNYMKTDDDE